MKKLLSISALLGSMVIFAPTAQEAKAADLGNNLTANAAPAQIRVQIGRQNRRPNVRTYTRIVQRGFATYRETYRTRYTRNGRVVTTLVSRVRVR